MKINSITPNYNNINRQQKVANSTPAFKGVAEEKISQLFGKVAETGAFKKGINKFAKSNALYAKWSRQYRLNMLK